MGSYFSRGLLFTEIVASALAWFSLMFPVILAMGGGMLSWETPTAFERFALSIGLVAFFPVIFLAVGYFRSLPGDFEFEYEGIWLLSLGAVVLVVVLTAWNLAMRPTSAYNNGLLLETALLGVPAVHLFAVALRNRLSNQSLERTREE